MIREFLSAGDVGLDDSIETDICIVGGGAAGIALARELIGGGQRVVLLEAGGFDHDADAEADSFEIEHVGTIQNNPIPSRGRWFGGSTNLWFGRIARPDAIDLEHRSWVPHSGWPLTIEELDPWMDVGARILEVAHSAQLRISQWAPNSTIEAFKIEQLTDLGVFLWSDAPNMARSSRSMLKRADNVVLITDATAHELVSADADSIASVSVVGPGGRTFRVVASSFVLAAGGLENPRLLLASTATHPNGVGNQHDNVGRYYLDHPRGEGLARVDLRGLTPAQLDRFTLLHERADSPYGKTQLRVIFDEHLQHKEELLNHALHGYLVSDEQRGPGFESYKRIRTRVQQRRIDDRGELMSDVAAVARTTPQLARLAVNRLRGRSRPTEFVVIDQLEQEPDRESRVTVIRDRLDRFGLPRCASTGASVTPHGDPNSGCTNCSVTCWIARESPVSTATCSTAPTGITN